MKHQILKLKSKKELRLKDIVSGSNSNGNPLVFINNHVTPFFGRLLAEGRRAVKDNRSHSDGCRVPLEENVPERIYRSTKELNALISEHHMRSAGKHDIANSKHKRSRSEDDNVSPNSVRKSKK